MTRYEHLPEVAGEDADRPEWERGDWDYVFVGAHNDMTPHWAAAVPPPKPEVEPITPDMVVEVPHIWALSWEEYADQSMQAVMRLAGRPVGVRRNVVGLVWLRLP